MQRSHAWNRVTKTPLWLLVENGLWGTRMEGGGPVGRFLQRSRGGRKAACLRQEAVKDQRSGRTGLYWGDETNSIVDGLDEGQGLRERGRNPGFLPTSHFRPQPSSLSIYPLVFLTNSQFKELSRRLDGILPNTEIIADPRVCKAW